MKKQSKTNFNREFHKIANKSIIFNEPEVVTEIGHFVQPSSQTNYKNEKLLIICKGYGKQSVEMANELLRLLRESMEALVKEDNKLNKEFDELLGKDMTEESKQRYYVLNLIDSCFEDLSTKSYDGSCSFGIAYIFSNLFLINSDNSLYIVKNKIIECYFIVHKEHETYDFKPLSSKSIPFQINHVKDNLGTCENEKEMTGFFISDHHYENMIAKKFFPEVSFSSLKLSKQDQVIFLMGNSECFCLFTEEELISLFRDTKNFKDLGSQILEVSKKKWKTIYQEDMTLIVSKFH